MFGRKKTTVQKLSYDPQQKTPVIRCSICNGEQVGGLKDLKNGKFEEVMTIRSSQDLELFREMTGKQDIPKEY